MSYREEADVRSIFLTTMSYPDLPEPDEEFSSWVTPKAGWFDPRVGNAMYHQYLNELEYADAVGFDAIGMNEHHNCTLTTMPSPNLMAAAVARRTQNAAIAVLGNTLAAYNPPTRVAEEMAMIDNLSGGRLIAGFVHGTPMDTAYVEGINPSELRQRFAEAHELIVRAWTSDEPFAFNGRFTQLAYVNPWPRPMQRPHPPIWMPAGGSPEAWSMTARNNYLYAYLTWGSIMSLDKLNAGFWETISDHGLPRNPFRLGTSMMILVADSMKECEELYAEPVEYFFNRVMKWDPRFTGPPGYLTEAAMRKAIGSAMAEAAKGSAYGDVGSGRKTFRDAVASGQLVAGSSEQVTETLIRVCKQFKIGNVACLMALGNMSEELTRHNIRMYAEKVLPNVRPLFEDEWEHEWWPRPAEDRVPLNPLAMDPATLTRAVR